MLSSRNEQKNETSPRDYPGRLAPFSVHLPEKNRILLDFSEKRTIMTCQIKRRYGI